MPDTVGPCPTAGDQLTEHGDSADPVLAIKDLPFYRDGISVGGGRVDPCSCICSYD